MKVGLMSGFEQLIDEIDGYRVEIVCPYCDNVHRVLQTEGTHILCLCGASGRYQRLGKTMDWFWIDYGNK